MESTELTPLYTLKDLTFAFLQHKEKRRWWKRRQQPDRSDDADKGDAARSGEFTLGPLNLEIARGKFTSILGRSGSGKTTLLSLLGFLRRPIEGEMTVEVDNQSHDVTRIWDNEKQLEAFRANHIGFALQKGELLPFLTLYENAGMVLQFLQQDANSIQERLSHIFGRLYQEGEQREEQEEAEELNRLMRSKPLAVSQGQYQRGAIARALANEPAILLADEPTGNLDELTGPQVMQIFREIVDQGVAEGDPKSVIVVTHDMLLGIEFADEIIVLSQGKDVSHYIAQKTEENKVWREKSDNSGKLYNTADFKEQLLKDIGEKQPDEVSAESSPVTGRGGEQLNEASTKPPPAKDGEKEQADEVPTESQPAKDDGDRQPDEASTESNV